MISNEPEDLPESSPDEPTVDVDAEHPFGYPNSEERREATPGATRPLDPNLPVRDMVPVRYEDWQALVEERDRLRLDKEEHQRAIEIGMQGEQRLHRQVAELKRSNRQLDAKVNGLQQRNDNQKAMLQSRQERLEAAERTIAHLESRTVDIPEARAGYHGVGRAVEFVEFPNSEDRSIDKIVPWLREVFQPDPRSQAANVIDTVEELIEQATRTNTGANTEGKVRVHPLATWWVEKAQAEVQPLIAKMEEYGGEGRALDLIEIGQAMRITGVGRGTTHTGQPTEGQTQELGIYFYLRGKFARWTAAMAEGRQVSDDTLHDIGIYVRMAQRIREAGGWPA